MPPEIQARVASHLRNPHDLENFARVSRVTHPIIKDSFNERKVTPDRANEIIMVSDKSYHSLLRNPQHTALRDRMELRYKRGGRILNPKECIDSTHSYALFTSNIDLQGERRDFVLFKYTKDLERQHRLWTSLRRAGLPGFINVYEPIYAYKHKRQSIISETLVGWVLDDVKGGAHLLQNTIYPIAISDNLHRLKHGLRNILMLLDTAKGQVGLVANGILNLKITCDNLMQSCSILPVPWRSKQLPSMKIYDERVNTREDKDARDIVEFFALGLKETKARQRLREYEVVMERGFDEMRKDLDRIEQQRAVTVKDLLEHPFFAA